VHKTSPDYLLEHNMPEADCFSFAFACISLQRGLSKANENKSYLCVLCGFAVKSTRY
jgi:hypothetical protein